MAVNKRDDRAECFTVQGNLSQPVLSLFDRSFTVQVANKVTTAFKEKKTTNSTTCSMKRCFLKNGIQKYVSQNNGAIKLRTHTTSNVIDSVVPNVAVDTNKLCRICLKQGNIPIFRDKNKDLAEAIMSIGGVAVSEVDIYPKYLCILCRLQLQNALMLRKKAQMSDMKLRTMEVDEKLGNIDEIISEADDCSDKEPAVFEECLPQHSESINHNVIGIIKVPKNKPEPEPILHTIETESKSANNISNDITYTDKDSIYMDGNFKRQKYRKPTNLKCEECEAQFSTWKNYIKHVKGKHPKIKKLQCIICRKLLQVIKLKKHMINHDGFVCDVCGKYGTSLMNFNRHYLTHSMDSPFKCSICSYRGKTQSCLKSHMMSHTGEKRFKCPKCPLRFVNSCNLKWHMYKHGGQRPYKCETCNLGFTSNYALKRHILCVHIGSYPCKICGESFDTKKIYEKHWRQAHKIP